MRDSAPSALVDPGSDTCRVSPGWAGAAGEKDHPAPQHPGWRDQNEQQILKIVRISNCSLQKKTFSELYEPVNCFPLKKNSWLRLGLCPGAVYLP